VIRSIGRLTQATTSCRLDAPSNPATTPPMLPSPITAIPWRLEFADMDGMSGLSGVHSVFERSEYRFALRKRPKTKNPAQPIR
jgi:hypothetical protein